MIWVSLGEQTISILLRTRIHGTAPAPISTAASTAPTSLIEQAEMTEDKPTAKSDAFTKWLNPPM